MCFVLTLHAIYSFFYLLWFVGLRFFLKYWHFDQRWLGRACPNKGPVRSPNLTTCDFFLFEGGGVQETGTTHWWTWSVHQGIHWGYSKGIYQSFVFICPWTIEKIAKKRSWTLDISNTEIFWAYLQCFCIHSLSTDQSYIMTLWILKQFKICCWLIFFFRGFYSLALWMKLRI